MEQEENKKVEEVENATNNQKEMDELKEELLKEIEVNFETRCYVACAL